MNLFQKVIVKVTSVFLVVFSLATLILRMLFKFVLGAARLAAFIGGLLFFTASTPLMIKEAHRAATEVVIGDNVAVIGNHQDTSFGTAWMYKSKLTGMVYAVTNAHLCDQTDNNTMVISRPPYSEKDVKSVNILFQSATDDICITEGFPDATGLTLAESDVTKLASTLGYPGGKRIAAHGQLIGSAIESMDIAPIEGQGVPGMPKEACQGANLTPVVKFYGTMFGFQIILMCTKNVAVTNTTIPIAKGASGSPVVNLRGEVIGMVWGVRNNGSAILVPIHVLHGFLGAR